MGKRLDIEEFQKDLKKMTLEEALIKHNISFKEAVNSMPMNLTKKSVKHKKRWKNNGRYIQERDGKFYLRKWIEDKTLLFGTYKSLDDAKKVREMCQERGWLQDNIKEYCEELGIEMAICQDRYKEKYE
jgi:hypothetical protein